VTVENEHRKVGPPVTDVTPGGDYDAPRRVRARKTAGELQLENQNTKLRATLAAGMFKEKHRRDVLQNTAMTDSAYLIRFITKAADFFSFPRTGKTITRNDELAPTVLYALTLREEGRPYQPIWINHLATGVHGLPAKGEAKVLILIREPMATIYRWFPLHWDRRAGRETRHGANILPEWQERCLEGRQLLDEDR